MSTKKNQLESYRKSLLNRVTAYASFIEYIENCLVRDDEEAKHSFHKIMVHNWSGDRVLLFETLSEYFSTAVIPVLFQTSGYITSFYTSSLSLIIKIFKNDFMFPFQRNMFNVDILFNDKNSTELFNNAITVEDIVCSVVSRRLNEKLELDLSDFCNDADFAEKKIIFFKLSLLSHFKILMLRMGRDTISLNLSNNNLSQVPLDILNFFIKGDLTSINLSNNNIPKISEVLRVSSKIEKLWIEGNPLCDNLDAVEYMKNVTMKFPRLNELDGVKLNQYGLLVPFIKNYLLTPDKRTKMIVEKFLTLYFAHYDSRRQKLDMFYETNATLTISTDFTEAEENTSLSEYTRHSRNAIDPTKRRVQEFNTRQYVQRPAIVGALCRLPATKHDPSTFTVDVLQHDKKTMLLVVNGVYKEIINNADFPGRILHFRRTFLFKINITQGTSMYWITNEMFTVSNASRELMESSFKMPIKNMNELSLINPDKEESEAIMMAFTHITQLKRQEVESRLKMHNWDIRKAIKDFCTDMRDDKITPDKFIEDDDFSDSSSLVNDEID